MGEFVTDPPDSLLGGIVPVEDLQESYGREARYVVAPEANPPTTKWDEHVARGLQLDQPGVDVGITSCAELGSSRSVAVPLAAFFGANGGEQMAPTTSIVDAGVYRPLDPAAVWAVVAGGTSSRSLQPAHVGHLERERAA
jgi:hypothetical protein